MRHSQGRHLPIVWRSNRRRIAMLAALMALALASVGLVVGSSMAEAAPGASDAARGMVYKGLTRAVSGPCAGQFVAGTVGKTVICSHGPDPAPTGVDVTARRTVADLAASMSTSATASGSIQCIDDGVSGPRVQAIYAVASDQPDRYSSISPLIGGWAGEMDGVFSQSAAATGGERHIRFVTNPDCSLNIVHVTLSPTGDDSFSNTITELRGLGYTRTDRKYLIWTDALVYCGIGQVAGNDWPGSTNAANSGPNFARVDSGCWGRTDHLSEVHELVHTLGAVQLSAPHSTGGYHCTDESDTMCYADAAGVVTTQVCPLSSEWLLDCNHDDYFNTSPAPGSYLDTHWNVANNVFLSGGTATSVSTSTPTTSSSTFSGTLSNKKPAKTFLLSVGSGDSNSVLSFSVSGKSKSTPTLTLRILTSNGAVVASGSGPSGLTVPALLNVGTYTWEVSGSTSVSFTLTVTYVLH